MTNSKIIQMYSDLTFDSQKHLYYWKGNRVPYSVTGLVNKHAHKFDPDKIVYGDKSLIELSARKASRESGQTVTTHELRHKWQTINTTACDLGTKVHNFLERFTGLETPTCPQEVAGVSYIKDLYGKYEISFRELRAYSRKYNFAGTMDIPLKVIGKDEYIIDDYKTNGDLFKAYDNLKPPFEYLESSPYNKYQLQLSYYQIMLEEIGLKIVDRRVVYLKADGTYKIFPLLNYTKEIKQYLIAA